ncbi:MAG: metallophosphoesterase [Bacteroidales bacterium]|nr:metallophosphoesterase [Bacteroidales bacterium]
MKIIRRTLSLLLLMSFLGVFTSCRNSSKSDAPFCNGGTERNMIVIISDIHLGADTAYAECVKNRTALEELLKRIKKSQNVKELVIAGDLFDEWFVPADIDTYHGGTQADFVKRIATTNIGIFNAINSIIQDKNFLVTYVPGNHDLTITKACVESVLPGINQARDSVLGLGTYSPNSYPEIAIEHGHRYNFFCAPDPFSNQAIAPGTILPPGYFFTRIAALSVQQGHPTPGDTLPTVYQNTSGSESQDLLYRYWKIWNTTAGLFPIRQKFNDSIIITNVNGFKGNYSFSNLVPYQPTPKGAIHLDLYNEIQDKWEKRQIRNNVAKLINTAEAIDSVDSAFETDKQANIQYFDNPKSNKRIVVFGHTHIAKIVAYQNSNNKKCIYANSGTWVDTNAVATTRNFVVITKQNGRSASQTMVKLYNLKNKAVNLMAKDSLSD